MRGVVLLAVLLFFDSSIYAQDEAGNAALRHRDRLFGDMGGLTTKLKKKGFEFGTELTQFYQGVVDGGTQTGSEYNGKLQIEFKFDFEKMFKWNRWSAEASSETRFGGPPVGGTGTISTVNTAALIPAPDETVTSVTEANLTRLFPLNLKKGELIALSFGRYNLVDLTNEDFFAGDGTERFLNIAQIGPLTVLREVPLITNAVSFAYLREGEPTFTFALLDPNDHSTTTGVAQLFADGVTLSPFFHSPTKYFGKTGKHSIGGSITTKAYTPFDSIRQVIIPGPPLNPVEPERGSWSVSYTFRQYIVEEAKKDGWGVFGQVSFANQDTSPISKFFNVGIGGNGLLSSRNADEFGIAYAFTDMSEVLKNNLDLLPFGGRLQVEHQVESFYNLHIAPWLQLTADLQILRPNRPKAETALVPGARLKLVF